jgi:hypothetical protein
MAAAQKKAQYKVGDISSSYLMLRHGLLRDPFLGLKRISPDLVPTLSLL